MSKHSLDVENVLGLVIFHCSFPVSKRVKSYSLESGLLLLAFINKTICGAFSISYDTRVFSLILP